jgi:hypothetical protein
MDEKEGKYRVLEGRPEERKPLVRQRHRWEDHITRKMDLHEIGRGGVWTRRISLRTERGGGELL